MVYARAKLAVTDAVVKLTIKSHRNSTSFDPFVICLRLEYRFDIQEVMNRRSGEYSKMYHTPYPYHMTDRIF